LLLAAVMLIFVLGFSLVIYLQSHKQSPKPEESIAVTATNDEARAETFAVTITNDEQPITVDQAVKIAGDLLGINKEARYTVKRDTVTDKTLPFVEVVDLPVWIITFEGVKVTFPGAAGPKPEFSTLTCLVDAKTGALLKVSSPLPATGGVIDNETHPEVLAEMMKETNFTAIEASRLADAGVKPLIPLLPEINKQNKTIQPAKQLVAYIGLYTGNGINTEHVNHSCWFIKTGGLHFPSLHMIVTDVDFYVDTTSGKAFMTGFAGTGDGTSPIPR